jgi:hypothetical protein
LGLKLRRRPRVHDGKGVGRSRHAHDGWSYQNLIPWNKMPHMKNPYKEFAKEFLPIKIRYLLIGESPPYTPPREELRYFYNYRNNTGRQILLSSISYSFLNKKFYNKRDNKEEYLRELMRQGVFLLDATRRSRRSRVRSCNHTFLE